jgi:hypothetical protein
MTERDNAWNKQYEQLVEFKRKNGHWIVPRRCKEDASLGKWVSYQRHFHRQNRLRLDRKGLLDEIGFPWRAVNGDPKWQQQYEKLVEFQRKNGNCLVPQKYQEDVVLGNWVNTQRQFHSNNKLRLDRTGLLEEIGFAWEAPRGGNTESRQRQFHANNKIPIYRKELLDELGSAWKADTVAARSSTTNVSCH